MLLRLCLAKLKFTDVTEVMPGELKLTEVMPGELKLTEVMPGRTQTY